MSEIRREDALGLERDLTMPRENVRFASLIRSALTIDMFTASCAVTAAAAAAWVWMEGRIANSSTMGSVVV